MAYSDQTGMISIVMPAYNVENYIARGITSCLRQSYSNWELIIVDDGSMDETAQVVERYASQDARVHLYQQGNGGVSTARNHGLELAQGAYVVFLDADDWLRDDALEILITLQEEHPDLLIACNKIWVQEADYAESFPESDRGYLPADQQNVSCIVVSRLQSLLNSGLETYNTSGVNKLYRTDILREHEIRFDPSIRYAEDGLFVFQYLLAVHGMLQCNESIGRILSRGTSATKIRFTRHHLSALTALEQMREVAARAHTDGALRDDEYRAVDASLRAYGGEQVYNNCRRYLDSDLSDAEVDQTFKRYLHRYSAAYCHAHGMTARFKYVLMEYLPMPIYRFIYRTMHA